jgi:hypothetical protein
MRRAAGLTRCNFCLHNRDHVDHRIGLVIAANGSELHDDEML